LAGLEKQVFLALFELIKEKASRLYTWKGKRMTRNKSVKNHYLKVIKI
jgi:hypothetical protein